MTHQTLYVVMRETGEYSERDVNPIRYALTEEEAKAAVELATIEAQSRIAERPKAPTYANIYEVLRPGGEWSDASAAPRVKLVRKPDADEIEAGNARLLAEYQAACLAMWCVDPRGPNPEASYHYEAVEMIPSSAGRAKAA